MSDLDAAYERAPEQAHAHAQLLPQAQVSVHLTGVEFPSWRWLKLQLLGANWPTLALLIAVLAVSSNINAQLDQQRAQVIASQSEANRLSDMLTRSDKVAARLVELEAQMLAYNATLNRGIELGFSNLTGDINALQLDIKRRTNVFGFQALGATVLPVDPGAVGKVLQFDRTAANSFDTTGGWNYDTRTFTTPRAGRWRFHAEGMVRALPAATGGLGQVGIVLATSDKCATADFYRKASVDYTQTQGAIVSGPSLTLIADLAQGASVTLCGWGSGTGTDIAFGITPVPGTLHQLMSFSGELISSD